MENFIIGLSGAQLAIDSYDLTHGIKIQKTYAHLMAPFMMAFSPAPIGSHHPAPWKAASGGLGYDILAEVIVPNSISNSVSHQPSSIAWTIAALLRIRIGPLLRVPVISNISFTLAHQEDSEIDLIPIEVSPSTLIDHYNAETAITTETLNWVKENWLATISLIESDHKFSLLLSAHDQIQYLGKPELALLQIWSALEPIFSPGQGELRFRISTNMASYLTGLGVGRMSLQKRIAKLYDARSSAAHGRQLDPMDPLIETYKITRKILQKMIQERATPSRSQLDAYVFGAMEEERNA